LAGSATKLNTSWCVFDIARLADQVKDLERQVSAPDLWEDSRRAQQLMRELSEARATVETWREIQSKADELLQLTEMAESEEATELVSEIEADVSVLATRVNRLEFELSFNGPYDQRSAILAIHAGAGGTESQDWAEMLLRMYLRWAERRGYETEVFESMPGEEAGIKSVTVEVRGLRAYGYLKSERGVHRLVRLSPFDSSHSRHTSFALVEVMPEVEEGAAEVDIIPDDIRVDVYRASGHGGQNVQKNSTAIRITHIPTGIVVTCQNERSQHRNRESALKVLESRLLEIELEKRSEEQAKLKGDHVAAGWGNQIRSYVLHPYKLVKDLRTGYETSDAASVLDGDLDEFLQAYLKANIGSEAA
jgi:peptide chain release factor 2